MWEFIEKTFDNYFKIKPIWILISILVGLIFYVGIKFLKPKTSKLNKVVIPLTACYVFLVLSYMVLSRHATGIHKYELNPFFTYQFMAVNHSLITSAVLNAVLFMPIGFLFPFITKSYRKAIIYGVIFSAVIEVLQLITTTGHFELDDAFHNIIGLCIGVFVCHQVRKAYFKRHPRRRHHHSC